MECSSTTLLAERSLTIRQNFSRDSVFRLASILFFVIPGIFFAQLAHFSQEIYIQFLGYGLLMVCVLFMQGRTILGVFQRPVFVDNGIKFKENSTYRLG